MDARGSQEDARPGESETIGAASRERTGPLHRCGQVQGDGGRHPLPLHRPAGRSPEEARPQGEALQEEIGVERRRRVRGCAAALRNAEMTQGSGISSKLPDVGTTIFTVMSRRAIEQGAVNVGQGFPDYPIDSSLADCVADAVAAGFNQYAPMEGSIALRTAIAAKM